MKIRKNFEAVFLAATVMATFAAYATAEVPLRTAAKPVVAAAVVEDAVDQNMIVVHMTAKRLTAAEKAAL